MAVSDNTRNQQEQARNRLPSQLSRYDLLLAVIPVLFMAAVLAYLFTPLSLHLAMGASAVTSGLLVADAVYFHPPTDARDVADAESVVERSAHDGE